MLEDQMFFVRTMADVLFEYCNGHRMVTLRVSLHYCCWASYFLIILLYISASIDQAKEPPVSPV